MLRSAPVTSSAESKPKDLRIPKIPDAWNIGRRKGEGYSPLNLALFIAVGKPTAKEFWESAYPGCPDFKKGRDEIIKRVHHLNLVSGLLLTTLAAFCTTDPPANSTLFPYTGNAAYTLLLLSLAVALGGLIVGSGIVFTMARCTSYRKLYTKPRFGVMLFIWAYPFLSVSASTLCFATALLISASGSDVPLIKYGGYQLLAIPMTSVFWFIWMVQGEPPKQLPWYNDVENGGENDLAEYSHSPTGSTPSLH